MELTNFEFWLISGLITLLIVVLGWFLSSLIGEIKGVRTEMNSLNEKLATVITNQDWHAKELTRLDARIDKIENH